MAFRPVKLKSTMVEIFDGFFDRVYKLHACLCDYLLGQIGMEGLPGLGVAGHYGIPKLQLQVQVHTSTGASEGNTEKGWKAAKIDDPNKIFNNSLILWHF